MTISSADEALGGGSSISMSLPNELRRWRQHWQKNVERSQNVPSTMKAADKDAFTNVFSLAAPSQ
jgi:hypothetical protein